MCVCVLPVLWKDEQLFGVVELLQDVGDELTPPGLGSTQLHEQQAGVQSDLRSTADTQLLKELLTHLRLEHTPQHGRHTLT